MRRRNMYYLTGQPGWMRLGYSPGWVGRSPSGLGPCAQYLMSGQWPATPPGAVGLPTVGGTGAGVDASQRVEFLKAQASRLEQQLQWLRQQLAALGE